MPQKIKKDGRAANLKNQPNYTTDTRRKAMYYCEKCKCEVSEPIWINENVYHPEVDTNCYEDKSYPICPSCTGDLEDMDTCACGNYKRKSLDWCQECLDIRDACVMGCYNKIRIRTSLRLSKTDVEDLIISFFDK